MRKSAFHRYIKESTGAATVEFVLVFVPLISIIFFIFEMSMAYHWALAAQKGVENGARLAVTLLPIDNSLLDARGKLRRYQKLDTSIAPGDDCFFNVNCVGITEVTCVGGSSLAATCNAARFQQVFNVVARHAYGLEPESLSITYEESGLGKATDFLVPVVTVSIANREFPLGLSLFGVDTRLPAVSATLVGESLGN